jgi:hypothetical protein
MKPIKRLAALPEEFADGSLRLFNATGNTLMFTWQHKWLIFVDGAEAGRYDKLSSFFFSPDGKRLAFLG